MKEPTCVSVVEAAVTVADDFVTAKWVVENTLLTPDKVGVSLNHLKMHKRLDCFESNGKLWWFSTPASDDRIFTHPTRKVETGPRKPRKQKMKRGAL